MFQITKEYIDKDTKRAVTLRIKFESKIEKKTVLGNLIKKISAIFQLSLSIGLDVSPFVSKVN